MRKILLLFLLIAGWAVIFFPLLNKSAAPLALNASAVHPSRVLPKPWHSSTPVQIQQAGSDGIPTSGAANPAASPCASRELQPGETLGEIARDCGISLVDLLAANPSIADPNRVFAGQPIAIPNPRAGRGGGDPLDVGAAAEQPGGFRPGAAVQVTAEDLPANVPARVGLGLASSGYQVLVQAVTSPNGRLDLTVNLPADAQPGEEAFLLVTIPGPPSIQRVSPSFTIGQP